MIEDLKNAPEGAVIILHACAHNPTGMINDYLSIYIDNLPMEGEGLGCYLSPYKWS